MEGESDVAGAAAGAPSELSREQATIYDRQIRLWGADAQRRMSRATLLLVAADDASKRTATGGGTAALFDETLKNTALAGIGRLLVLSSAQQRHQGVLGGSLKEVVKNVQEMNAFNRIELVHDDKDDERGGDGGGADARELGGALQRHLSAADVVVVFGFDDARLAPIARFCRSASIGLFVAEVFGTFGGFFSDLGSFAYGDGQRANFPAFESVFTERAATLRPAAVAAPNAALLSALLAFREKHSRFPASEEEAAECVSRVRELCDAAALPPRVRTPPPALHRQLLACDGAHPAVSAVIGGVLGRYVINAIIHKDEPLRNLFVFDAATRVGVVELVQNTS